MKRLALALAIAIALLAPAVVAGVPHRGIEGSVQIGPVHPLNFETRPYAATIEIAGQTRSWVVRSGADGRFAIVVPPGDYTVRGLTAGILPHAPRPISIHVAAHAVSAVTLIYDSGIR